MNRTSTLLLLSVSAWPLAVAVEAAEPDREPTADDVRFFEATVRPLLEENCFRCHGGEDSRRRVRVRSGLRLTSRASVLEGGERGPAVDLERPGQSLLLEMVSYKDEDHQMPPSGKLPPEAIDALTRWVELGAPWTPGEAAEPATEPHGEGERDVAREIAHEARTYWAYQRVRRPAIPDVKTPGWAERPIDAFVAARLEAHGLKPNPHASRRVLIRRAFHDVTGLPPSPEEVEAFVADDSPTAWEDLIDRLLDSPRFGEKWARHWLDLVRYAESNGYERDSDKDEIWRYRDYVIRAFNGDKPYDRFIEEQLAGDELDEVTADSIIATGYHRLHLWDDEPADRTQSRYDNLDDIVRTTSGVFLGLSLGCARCHEHKKDPLEQRDYYAFMAFFNNLTPMGKNDVFRSLDGLARDRETALRRRELEERRRIIEERLVALEETARRVFEERDPDLGADRGADTGFEQGEVLLADSREAPQEWLYSTEPPPEAWMTNGYSPDRSRWKTGRGGFGRRGTPGSVVRTRWRGGDIWLRGEFRLTAIPPNLELTIHHDEDAEIWLNGQLVAQFKDYLTQYKTVPLDGRATAALQTGKNILAVHCRHTGGGQYIDVGLRVGRGGREIESLIAQRGTEILSDEEMREYRELRAEEEQLRTALAASSGGGRAMCVAERGKQAPEMHIHIRGNAHVPGDPVEPDFPAVLGAPEPTIPDLPDGVESSGRRRALAEWIASEENPLTARVIMNRVWQHYFGRAIVPTPNDFGRLGEPPTHPELLDWLAAELMAGNWRLKRIHRTILLSEAYRMSSRADAAALELDPENRLFWRHDMRRLTAEEVRDSVLVVSGNFNPKMFGPSMYPELPPAVLATSSTGAGKWGRSPKEETARRSIYIKVKRSLLVPTLTDFDFANTDSSCAVRFSSTVPTQALGMLNGRFINEQASIFAARLRRERPGDAAAQIRRALELVTTRPATADEVASCLAFVDSLREEDDVTENEALERIALLALNLNEFIYLD